MANKNLLPGSVTGDPVGLFSSGDNLLDNSDLDSIMSESIKSNACGPVGTNQKNLGNIWTNPWMTNQKPIGDIMNKFYDNINKIENVLTVSEFRKLGLDRINLGYQDIGRSAQGTIANLDEKELKSIISIFQKLLDSGEFKEGSKK